MNKTMQAYLTLNYNLKCMLEIARPKQFHMTTLVLQTFQVIQKSTAIDHLEACRQNTKAY